MEKYFRYPPEQIPEGYRIKEVTCNMCNGTQYFSGKYGMTACDYCYKGKAYKLVHIYNKKSK